MKYEDVYLNDYGDGLAAGRGLSKWFERYNQQRPHQGLHYATPAQWYESAPSYGGQPATWEAMERTRRGRGKPSAELGGARESDAQNEF